MRISTATAWMASRYSQPAVAQMYLELARTPPPFEPLGGLSDVPSGGSLITTMDFEPGDYFVAAGRHAFTVLPARR